MGSTFSTMNGIVCPPVKRTCRANGSPLVWWKLADSGMSIGRMYVPEILLSHSHVVSDVLISVFGLRNPALSPAAEKTGLEVPKPVPRDRPAAPTGQFFFVAE